LSIWKWLYPIAGQFETYTVPKARVEFVTSATTDLTGRVYMYFDGDSKDSGATTVEQVAMQYNMQSGNLWEKSTQYNIPPRIMKRSTGQKLFIRKDDQTPTGEISAYDAGMIHVLMNPIYLSQPAVSGLPVGEIWVHYTFNFQVPNESISGPTTTGRRMLQMQTAEDQYYIEAPQSVVSVDPFALQTAPVVNTLTNTPTVYGPTGLLIEDSGVYGISTAQDLGTVNPTPGATTKTDVEAKIMVSDDDGLTWAAVEQTETNSVTVAAATNEVNWAEANANWIVNLVKGERMKLVSEFFNTTGTNIAKKGLSMAVEYFTALAPALLLATQKERKEMKRIKMPSFTPSRSSIPRSLEGKVSDASPAPEAQEAQIDESSGKAYVMVPVKGDPHLHRREYLK
jgi:hypothetical protein